MLLLYYFKRDFFFLKLWFGAANGWLLEKANKLLLLFSLFPSHFNLECHFDAEITAQFEVYRSPSFLEDKCAVIFPSRQEPTKFVHVNGKMLKLVEKPNPHPFVL